MSDVSNQSENAWNSDENVFHHMVRFHDDIHLFLIYACISFVRKQMIVNYIVK